MNDLLELFSLSLQLQIVAWNLLLKVKIFLEELIPFSLAHALSFLKLVYNPSIFNVFLRQVF